MKLNRYKSFCEALKPSQYRKYVKYFDREKYLDIFKSIGDDFQHDRNYFRVYIPLIKDTSNYISTTHKKIYDFLSENNCELIDYVKGKAKFNSSKNETSIGKILKKLKNQELFDLFNSDEKRKSLMVDDDLLVVISRHPYDIVGSDTDRNWTNCMTIGSDKSNKLTSLMKEFDELSNKDKSDANNKKLKELEEKIMSHKKDGENIKYLIHEVKEGSLISYLIKSSDKNINNPLGVLNIKPFESKSGETILVTSSNMYGLKRNDFKKTVDSILENYFNKDVKSTIFKINPKVYKDEDKYFILKSGNIDEICNFLKIKKYIINDDNTVDVNGDVRIDDLNLREIPINFGKVYGDFHCQNNKLTSLKGCPRYVSGDFNCFGNNLTSLEFSPIEVGGDFDCHLNNIITLFGCSKNIGGGLNCRENQIKTFKSAPDKIQNNHPSNHIFKITPIDCGKNPIFEIWGFLGNLDYTTIIKELQDIVYEYFIDEEKLLILLEKYNINPESVKNIFTGIEYSIYELIKSYNLK